MVAGESSCTCASCGQVCGGRFRGCPDVWARGSTAKNRRALRTRGEPALVAAVSTMADVAYAGEVGDVAHAQPMPFPVVRSASDSPSNQATGGPDNPSRAVPQPPPPQSPPAPAGWGPGPSEVFVTDDRRSPSSHYPSYNPMAERESEFASRLRTMAAGPGDPESLRRGLLWVAGEMQACEQAMRHATGQMAVVTTRLAAVEAREQALAQATAGVDSLRRELVWLSGEVQARSDALTRATAQIEVVIGELSAFRVDAAERIAGLEVRGGTGDVRGELDRYAAEASGGADFAALARAAAAGGALDTAVRELRADLDRVAHESAVAADSVPAEAFDQVVTALDQRLRAVETLQGDLDGVYRELDRVSGHMTGGEGLLADVAERLQPLEDALVATRQELLEARGHRGSADERVDEITRRLDTVDGRVEGVDGRIGVVAGQVEAVDERVAALAALTSDIEGMYRELDRVAELSLSRDGALAGLESSVGAVRQELDRLAGEVFVAQQGTLGQVAQVAQVAQVVDGVAERMGPLELLVDQVAELSHELRRVSDESGSAEHAALAATTEQLGLAGRLRVGEELLAEISDRLGPVEEAVAAARQELLDVRGDRGSAGERMDDITRLVAGVGERVDMVDERVGMVGERVNAIDERVAALAVLTSDIEGMYRELDRVAELTLSRDGALAQIADRTTPLEISVSNLRQELDRLAGEVLVAQQGALNHVAFRVDGVAERMGPLELLVDQVADLGQELRRVSEEAGSAQQAALAATTEQLGLAGRLRMLEGLPADIEGMYRDFERVAEATVGREDRHVDVLQRQAAVDTALEGLRAELERIAGQGQSTELDLRRRLAALESLTTDLDALYRELGRVTSMTTEHEDRAVGFESTVSGVRDSLAELRERIEDERIYTTEQVTGLWARMRAVEGVPADVERVSTEVEKLAQAVSSAMGDSNEVVDGVARRVQALESLPSDVDGVRQEIERLAESARAREEQIAGLRGQIEPLESALAALRDDIERVRGEVVAAGEGGRAGVDDRLERLEALPQTVDAALRDLTRTSENLTASQQASLANASVLLQDFNDRLRALEALPADMEGLYAALYRVAESVKNLGDERQQSS